MTPLATNAAFQGHPYSAGSVLIPTPHGIIAQSPVPQTPFASQMHGSAPGTPLPTPMQTHAPNTPIPSQMPQVPAPTAPHTPIPSQMLQAPAPKTPVPGQLLQASAPKTPQVGQQHGPVPIPATPNVEPVPLGLAGREAVEDHLSARNRWMAALGQKR